MAHYALLDENNVVVNVITGRDEDEFLMDWEQFYSEETGMRCLRTSYNTYGGKHDLGKVPFRKNYAGIGYTYDEARDAFIPPKPGPDYRLNEESCLWEKLPSPEALYDSESDTYYIYMWDQKYVWNPEASSWQLSES